MLIGKSINFLRTCCKDTEWTTIAPPSEGLQYGKHSLEDVIQQVGNSVNQRLIHILFEKYKLHDHCLAVKRYLLLGQGDFIQCLMDLIGYE
jgi:gamma-tubulin complex component 3